MFFHEKEGVGSSLIFLSVFGVCVCFLLVYTISITIICVSQEGPSLIASNQQIYDLQVNNC